MSRTRILVLAAVAGMFLAATTLKTEAQVGVNVAVAPDCPYGYYDYSPYSCVPDGYYGQEWFHGGVFIGAGPWFQGPDDFHGSVDNSFDPRNGYNGPAPKVGDKAAAERRSPDLFKGNEKRDGRGHVGDGKH
jgi:hypothetical protein